MRVFRDDQIVTEHDGSRWVRLEDAIRPVDTLRGGLAIYEFFQMLAETNDLEEAPRFMEHDIIWPFIFWNACRAASRDF